VTEPSRPLPPDVPARDFESPAGVRVTLVLDGGRVVELHDGKRREHDLGEPLRAFVFVANRGRALTVEGFAEVAPPGPPREVTLASWEALEGYASRLDETRSLPRQELALVSSITPALARKDARLAEALALFLTLDWPSTFDVAGVIEALDDPEPALHAALARELTASRRYPKELARVATQHASPRIVALALDALERTPDPDAWMDVLIEGEPALAAGNLPALRSLAKRAPSRDVAKMIADIARDLERAGKRRRR
jgi:hypothetical protein